MSEKKCQYCGKPLEAKEIFGVKLYFHTCNCLDKLQKEKEEEKKRELILKKINKSNFPQENIDIIFGKHIINFNDDLIIDSVKKYINQLDVFIRNKVGLFLLGAPGVGKTISLIYLSLKIIEKYLLAVKFETAEGIANTYFSYEKDKYILFKNIPVLIIDDIRPQKWDMFDLINYRTSNYKLTFFSSNYSFEEISKYFGPAVMSRIKSKTIIDNIKNTKDKRKLILG